MANNSFEYIFKRCSILVDIAPLIATENQLMFYIHQHFEAKFRKFKKEYTTLIVHHHKEK